MNIKSGKCLDADDNSVVIETDCNPSTAKHWKLLNDGKQLCDTNSDPKCVSVKVNIGKKDPSYPTFDQMLYLAPMLREECGKKNCKNCWVQFNFTQHMTNPSKTKNDKIYDKI